jgi:hypothetical protein
MDHIMTALASAIDALFGDPHIARHALWRAGGSGEGVTVRVVTRQPDQVAGFGDSRAILPTMLIDVRRSEVAKPATGDTVEIDGEPFAIIAPPVADNLRLVWTCEAAPPP